MASASNVEKKFKDYKQNATLITGTWLVSGASRNK